MFKLHEIVLVKHPGYQHFGEILSRPTPEDTYMVRMVPGDPGTLREVPSEQLAVRPEQHSVKYVHYAAVNGHGAFPVDMLRYDHCAPLNFDPETGEFTSFGFDERIVARASGSRHPGWTTARWASFSWGLRELKTEKIGEE
jgi:hypothetical protein